MLCRFRRYGVFVGALTLLSTAVFAGCGGTPETAKTPPVDTEKKAATDAKSAPPSDEKKPADDSAKADKPSDKPAPAEAKPTGPKERFALPNVEFTSNEDRQKVMIGGKEITAEACLLDTSVPEMKDEWFPNPLRAMAAGLDGSLYIYDQDKKVRHYIPEPGDTCKLAIDPKFGDKGMLKFPDEPEKIMVLADGTFVALGFSKIQKYVGGKIEETDCRVNDLFADGKTAFRHFSDEVSRVDIAAECKETIWKFKGWDPLKAEAGKDPEKWGVQSIRPWDKDYLLLMTLRGDHYIGIQSSDGKLKMKLGKDREKDKDVKEGEDMCYVADMEKCAAGLCVLDSNCRRITAWDPKKGTMVDSAEISELTGVFYPWPVALIPAKGVSYLGMTAKEKMPENAPKDAKEISHAIVFRIKGLN